MYIERSYRDRFSGDLLMKRLRVGETDLAVCLTPEAWTKELEEEALAYIRELRSELQSYIASDRQFFITHQPHIVKEEAPSMVIKMARAGNLAKVGPMAAVAGAFSEYMGRYFLKISSEVIVENGGDIFLAGDKDRIVSVFAGRSPFSEKVGLNIKGCKLPLGICTSSGTVGPSFSYGKADAVVVVSSDTMLADAVATAAANQVIEPDDVSKAVDYGQNIKGISGILAIKDDKMAVWGDIELVKIS